MRMELNSRVRRCFEKHFILLLLCFVLLPGLAFSQEAPSVEPLPQDSGKLGLQETLRRLHTTARLMQTTAHPDDEDGGLLTLESRGKGTEVVLLTLNRGEGGQNKVGSNLFDVLGVLRTLELLAADKYYSVEQRFTRVADFGFSKSAAETFQKWQDHDPALSDMVRVIRTFRPDVIVSRFQGTTRDGHGHHEATGILTREAFRAAADPKRFPEQLKEGLQPWQAKKLYVGIRGSDDYTVALDTGANDPLLGMSYVQFAMQGLKHQLSQGAGAWNVQPGPHMTSYKLVDSVLSMPLPGTREQSFFDGIDTSLHGLTDRIGTEQTKVRFLRPALLELEGIVDEATKAAGDNPAQAGHPLLLGLRMVDQLVNRVETSSLSPVAKAELLTELERKRQQFDRAAKLALGLALEAKVDAPRAPRPEDLFMAVAGQAFTVTAKFKNQGPETIQVKDVSLDVPAGWNVVALDRAQRSLAANEEVSVRFRVTVAESAPNTRPVGYRTDPETQGVYAINPPGDPTLPFPPPPIHAHAIYELKGADGSVKSAVQVSYLGSDGMTHELPLAVGPALGIGVEPSMQVIPTSRQGKTQLTVSVRNNSQAPVEATVRLNLPRGWRAEPVSQPVKFAHPGETKLTFQIVPGDLHEQRYQLSASAEWRGKIFSEAYTIVSRPDLDAFYYYQPAIQRVSAVDVQIPKELKIGYIMGAGDDIPAVLQQIGLNVEMITPQTLATGALSRFGTIILGIRAYDTRDDVRANNKRLLDYVSNGGTLVVQYNSGTGDFNSGHYTPYPLDLSRERVTVEEAPVEILAPQDRIFHYPNDITARDFAGWVQERGIYFANKWDSRFEPLLSSHDPGEAELKGGLLRATYGKGTYIYTGYVFFRELPAGVPGAVRLFVNLLSAGH